MKALSEASLAEKKAFFESFDQILCDVDGVLRRHHELIPGAQSTLAYFQNLKKNIKFVSNNSTKSQEKYFEELKVAGYNLTASDIIQPLEAIVNYLEKINFDKDVFLIGLPPLRNALEKAGFRIAEYTQKKQIDTMADYVEHCMITDIDKKIGAVIVDMEYELSDLKLQRAATYLENKDVLFITGGSDRRLILKEGKCIIGPGAYQDVLENISGRKALNLSKPTNDFGEFVKDKCRIENPEKVLFIGDSISEDMVFATNCGFQKLLVLSGVTKKEDLDNWQHLDKNKPRYYADSLKDVFEFLKDVYSI